MEVVAIIFIVVSVFEILLAPILIGKERGEYTAGHYIYTILVDGVLIWLLWNAYL